MPDRVLGVLVVAAALLLAAVPRIVRAQLSSEGTHGTANAHGTADAADVSSVPGSDGLAVSVGAAATRSLRLNQPLWQEDFVWEAVVLDACEVGYGVDTAALSLSVNAKPQLVYATPLNQGRLAREQWQLFRRCAPRPRVR